SSRGQRVRPAYASTTFSSAWTANGSISAPASSTPSFASITRSATSSATISCAAKNDSISSSSSATDENGQHGRHLVLAGDSVRRQPLPRRGEAGAALDAGAGRRAEPRSNGQGLPAGEVRQGRARLSRHSAPAGPAGVGRRGIRAANDLRPETGRAVCQAASVQELLG